MRLHLGKGFQRDNIPGRGNRKFKDLEKGMLLSVFKNYNKKNDRRDVIGGK